MKVICQSSANSLLFLAKVSVTCLSGPGSLMAPGRLRLVRLPLPWGLVVTC